MSENRDGADELLSVQEAASRRGVAASTIYEAVKRGALPSRRVLGRIGLSTSDVDAWEPATYGGTVRAKKTRGPGRRTKGTMSRDTNTG